MRELTYEQYYFLSNKRRKLFHRLCKEIERGKRRESIFKDENVRMIYDDLMGNNPDSVPSDMLRNIIKDVVIANAAWADKPRDKFDFTLDVCLAYANEKFGEKEKNAFYQSLLNQYASVGIKNLPAYKVEQAADALLWRERKIYSLQKALSIQIPGKECAELFDEAKRLFEPILNYEILVYLFWSYGNNDLEDVSGQLTKEDAIRMLNEYPVLEAVFKAKRNAYSKKYKKEVKSYIDVLRELVDGASSDEVNRLKQSFLRLLIKKHIEEYHPIVNYWTNSKFKDFVDKSLEGKYRSKLASYVEKTGLRFAKYTSGKNGFASRLIDKTLVTVHSKLVQNKVRIKNRTNHHLTIQIINALHFPQHYATFASRHKELPYTRQTIERVKKRISRYKKQTGQR